MGATLLRKLTERVIRSGRWRGRGRALTLLLRLNRGRPIRSTYGKLLRVRPEDRTCLFCLTGSLAVDYDDVKAEVDRLEPGMAFVDIGANAGLFSILASARVGPEGVVIAFEPNPEMFRELVANAAANRVTNVFPFNSAIGDRTRLARFSAGAVDHSGIGHLYDGGAHRVLELSIDELGPLFEALIGDRAVLIKIDVEGAELLVARGMSEFLRRPSIRGVVAEIDPEYMARYDTSAEDLYSLLRDRGFGPSVGLGARAHYNEVFVRDGTDVASPASVSGGRRGRA